MKSVIIGFIFGIILSVFALFVGLQVSSLLASVLLFPTSVMSTVFSQPYGDLPVSARVGLYIFSGVFWALTFWLITWIKHKFFDQG